MLARIRKVFVGNNSDCVTQNDHEIEIFADEDPIDETCPGEGIQGTGTITAIDTEVGVGIIDGQYRFSIAKFSHLQLKVDSRVEFKAHHSFKLSEWEVVKIRIKTSNLEAVDTQHKSNLNQQDSVDERSNSQKNRRHNGSTSMISSLTSFNQKPKAFRKVSCKVTKIDPTYFTVQQSSQSVVLHVSKEVFSESYFVMIGDWLEIGIENEHNLVSRRNPLDIQEDDKVVSVQWTEKSTYIGQVNTRQGIFCVDDIYCPEKELSKGGKDLHVGDYCKVTYVLSDQYKALPDGDGNITFTKRSQKVEQVSDKEKGNTKEENEELNILKQHQEFEELCQNKNNIVISPRFLKFGDVKVDSEIEKNFEITNKGSDRVVLNAVTLKNDQGVCAFSVRIQNPEGNHLKVVDANSTIYVTVACKPKLLGHSQEICVFNFISNLKSFQIGRKISLRALVEDPQNFPTILDNKTARKTRRELAKEDRNCLLRLMLETQSKVHRGPSSTRHPFFLPVKLLSYMIPEEVQHIYYEEQLKGGRGTRLLYEKFPNVDWNTFNFDNYEERFHLSLYLEELECRKLRKRLDLKSIAMTKDNKNSLLFFSVPEHAVSECRPLISIGEIVTCCYTDENTLGDLDDKILKAEQSSDNSDDENETETTKTTLYQGYIYDINNEGGIVYIKFSKEFYESYQEDRPVDVNFQQKRINFRRQYHAVVLGKKLLGNDWLFPSEDTAEVKPPKIQYIEDDCLPAVTDSLVESMQNSTVSRGHSGLRKKDNTSIIDKRAVSLHEHHSYIEDRGVITNAVLRWENRSLNAEQKDAVRRILRGQCRPLPYIIFGPPGTGKSVTLVEAIMQVNKLDTFSRILVTAPSNQAADLIAERLALSENFQPGDFVRLNGFMRNPCTIPETIKKFCADGEKLNSIAKHKIIVCTISTAGQFFQLNVNPEHFTHVFIDEAGYSTEPETLIACVLSAIEKQGQIILAGDPNQLQPVLFHNSQVHKILRKSLLERYASMHIYSPDPEKYGDEIYNRVFITMLTRSYRLNEITLAVPSRRFYNGNLVAAASIDKDLLEKLPFIRNKNIPLLFHGLRNYSLQEENTSWCNKQEVQQCCRYYTNLKKAGVRNEDIGIISLYRKQVEKIKLALKYQNPNEKDLPKVATIQEFQGGERKVIIISTVISYKSSPTFSKVKLQGFLYSSKMFNVTVTRAKSLMIIVGDPHSVRYSSDWLDLLQQCVGWGCYIGCDLPVSVKRNGDLVETSSSSGTEINEGVIENVQEEINVQTLSKKYSDSLDGYDDECTSAFDPFN